MNIHNYSFFINGKRTRKRGEGEVNAEIGGGRGGRGPKVEKEEE